MPDPKDETVPSTEGTAASTNVRCWSSRSGASDPETMNSVPIPSNARRAASPSAYVARTTVVPDRVGARVGSRTTSRCGTPAADSSRATRPPMLPVDPVTASSSMPRKLLPGSVACGHDRT